MLKSIIHLFWFIFCCVAFVGSFWSTWTMVESKTFWEVMAVDGFYAWYGWGLLIWHILGMLLSGTLAILIYRYAGDEGNDTNKGGDASHAKG